MTACSYSRRFSQLAQEHPHAPMVSVASGTHDAESSISWGDAERASNQFAWALHGAGIRVGDYVTIALPNGIDFVLATIASWKVGAVPQPVSARLPAHELDAIVELADSRAVIGVDETRFPGRVCWPTVAFATDRIGAQTRDTVLPDATSPAWKAPTSGGSTGRPKLIVSSDASTFDPNDRGVAAAFGFSAGGTTLMPGPLYHNGPFIWAFTQLLEFGHLVLLERFDAATTLAALQRYRAEILYLVPTMMSRIWKLPKTLRQATDISSLTHAWHLAAPCPAWLKHAWLEWLGPERLWELYGGTEGQAATVLNGVEWLAHEGSVGRPISGEIKIVDDAGEPVAAGVTGEVYMRPEVGRITYYYLGAEAKTLGDRWESLGDMGWLDEDGFLYLADRKSDMILSGGANIYPAEVEAALERHPAVRSSAVIGLADDDMGQIVHAIVQADGLTAEVLIEFVAQQLVSYKVPRTVEFVETPLRDDAGKVRRSALLAERDVRA